MTSVDFDPMLAAELQALVPPDEHANSDWRDVERRTGPPRANRRLLVAAAVMLATLLVVVPALAALTNWVDFSHAPTASAPVVKRFADLSREAPSGLDPRAIATETRRLEIDDAQGKSLRTDDVERAGRIEIEQRAGRFGDQRLRSAPLLGLGSRCSWPG